MSGNETTLTADSLVEEESDRYWFGVLFLLCWLGIIALGAKDYWLRQGLLHFSQRSAKYQNVEYYLDLGVGRAQRRVIYNTRRSSACCIYRTIASTQWRTRRSAAPAASQPQRSKSYPDNYPVIRQLISKLVIT